MRLLSLGACLLLAAAASAEDRTYKIKLKDYPDAGKSLVHREKQKGTNSTKVVGPDGKVLIDDAVTSSDEVEYTLTVLAADAKGPTKYKRAYNEAERRKGKKTVTPSYQGRTVLFEKRKGKFVVSVEGKPPLDPKDLEELTRRANGKVARDLEKLTLPDKPVKVGGSWTIPAKAFADLAGRLKIDPEKSKGRGKLLKAYEKGGKTWGVFEWRVELAVTQGADVKFDPPASFVATARVEAAIDGSSTAGTKTVTVKFAGRGTAEQGGMKVEVETSSGSSETETRSAEK
jgi:hypothetical protein